MALVTGPSPTASKSRLRRIQDTLNPQEWWRVGGMALTVVGLHIVGWGLLALSLNHHYHISKTELFGLGTGVLAYTLGMRHAFDADHIAAIDNTTRKLMNDGKRPLSVGFFFSLGHSTVVFVLAVLLNFGIRALNLAVSNDSSGLHQATGIVGTSVSGTFLYLIAAINVVVLVSIVKVFREMRSGQYDDEELERQLNKPGPHEPVPRALLPADRHPVEDVPARRALRSGLRHGDRGGAARPGRHRRGRRTALLRHLVAARSSSRPACACSTRSTGAS